MPMQPSPIVDTVRSAPRAADPRVRVPTVRDGDEEGGDEIVMTATLHLRACSKSTDPGGSCQSVLIDPDLAVDRTEVSGRLGELGQHPVAVRREHGQPLGLVSPADTTPRTSECPGWACLS